MTLTDKLQLGKRISSAVLVQLELKLIGNLEKDFSLGSK
jgi:hypothetical protein